MYVYYEHHKDADGKIILTEMRLSSFANGTLAISHKNPIEQLLKGLCLSILKFPPIGVRSMDEKNWVWSYFGQYGVTSTYGEEVLLRIQNITRPLQEVKLIEVQNLAVQALQHKVNLAVQSQIRPEDFFYQHTASTGTTALSKEEILLKLKELILAANIILPENDFPDKKTYRQAAMKYHPDRNNGDGSKMSELNMLWGMYNA